jgi:Zn-dependent protease/predicted transcriptional regulator
MTEPGVGPDAAPAPAQATAPARPIGRKVGELFGFEIRVSLAWVMVLAIIAWISVSALDLIDPPIPAPVEWALGVFVAIGFFLSAIAHDVSHAIAARRRGMPVKTVTVSYFGGASVLEPAAQTPGADFRIAIVGPLVSLAIGLSLGAITLAIDLIAEPGSALEDIEAGIALVAGLNLIVGVVNLIPGYPLDGGRIARAIGWRRTGSIDGGWRAASLAGRVAGYLAVGAGLMAIARGPFSDGVLLGAGGWYLLLTARQINERVRVNSLIGGLQVKDAMEPSTVSVGPNLTVDTFAGQLLDESSDLTAVPVVNEGGVVGVLGMRQLQRLQRRLWATTRVSDVMAKPPRLILLSALDSLDAAVDRLYRTGLDGLPVVEDGALVGVLTRRSVGKLVHERGLALRGGGTAA